MAKTQQDQFYASLIHFGLLLFSIFFKIYIYIYIYINKNIINIVIFMR
jgi:hypothetical protein